METSNDTKPPIAPAHTPGPWYFQHIEWGDEVSDDWTVCEDLGDGTGRHVAHVAHINQGERQPLVELANARLIAAAPDLLKACRNACTRFAFSDNEIDQIVVRKLKEAIDKATKP